MPGIPLEQRGFRLRDPTSCSWLERWAQCRRSGLASREASGARVVLVPILDSPRPCLWAARPWARRGAHASSIAGRAQICARQPGLSPPKPTYAAACLRPNKNSSSHVFCDSAPTGPGGVGACSSSWARPMAIVAGPSAVRGSIKACLQALRRPCACLPARASRPARRVAASPARAAGACATLALAVQP